MKNKTTKLRIFAFKILCVFVFSVFLIYDKIDIDSITYLKYLH